MYKRPYARPHKKYVPRKRPYHNPIFYWNGIRTSIAASKALSKLKAIFRGRKTRNNWYAGAKGTLHGGKFRYN